jgi:predicted  nucleic acid-binding Zn-ribbon protein
MDEKTLNQLQSIKQEMSEVQKRRKEEEKKRRKAQEEAEAFEKMMQLEGTKKL